MVFLESEKREILFSLNEELTTEEKETLQYKLVQCYNNNIYCYCYI